MTRTAELSVVELKRCPRCEESLPLSEFGICRARKDGLIYIASGAFVKRLRKAGKRCVSIRTPVSNTELQPQTNRRLQPILS